MAHRLRRWKSPETAAKPAAQNTSYAYRGASILWISSGSYRSSFQALKLAACAIVGTCIAAAQANTGVHPRATPGDYDAAQQGKTVTYAASVLSADQVKHIFSIDISKNYLV